MSMIKQNYKIGDYVVLRHIVRNYSYFTDKNIKAGNVGIVKLIFNNELGRRYGVNFLGSEENSVVSVYADEIEPLSLKSLLYFFGVKKE